MEPEEPSKAGTQFPPLAAPRGANQKWSFESLRTAGLRIKSQMSVGDTLAMSDDGSLKVYRTHDASDAQAQWEQVPMDAA